jgi:hypothetical protein
MSSIPAPRAPGLRRPAGGTADAKAMAAAKLSARRRRIRRIRVTVVAIAVTVFIASFAAIYVRMAEGLDPRMSRSSWKFVVAIR